ncbi:hypothetical protein PPYR_01837 [Photinus pyralis]|uniref:CABIT domain-containing protein n=1 Tax=Photinus pyralis TaxID=7054 RepID=A0A1Y1NFZ0_PHOPY|nr:uncharacterized protein LOC116158854 [Photinus pyralis]XP_031327566.1 uncharacterized protein LOC116158854 [Photinus pyralis]KAB0804867.1 hypothetical protein PPYR_01837 [Photinus pyralis]
MFPNATVSSRSSSSRSGNSCSRNSSMPSLRMPNPLLPKTSFNPLYRNTDAFTSFDASNFAFHENKRLKKEKQPILRRFNSHDSHTNLIDVRVESNTSNSNKSRTEDSLPTPSVSPNSTEERNRRPQYEARDFLEKYSLPRIVRVEDGEPLLLYRCFDSFTKVQARGVSSKKGKEKADLNTLHFPEGYPGWFSLTNEKGEKAAVAHSSVLQLVREQVCSFISIQSFTAYTAGNQDSSDGMNARSQYLKTQIRGGQVFQLRAVFQHQDRSEGGKHSTRSSRISRSTRDKDLANRYAQLTSQNNQELYVPLTTKGEFYEIYSTMKARLCFPGLIDKTGPLALDKDCLYKLTHLLRRIALPVKVKLLSGSLPPGVPKEFTDSFVLEKKIQEPLMVTCTLPPPSEDIKHEISCINLNSRVKISKCTLGFDSESRLFKSQRVQSTLAFCHKNVDSWYREVRLIPNIHLEASHQTPQITCVECRKLNRPCTDTCRAKYEEQNVKQLITKQVIDKFPKPKKWYRHFKILGLGSESNSKFEDMKDPMDGIEKGKSMERYKDMSKLIEDKFGKKSYNPVKKSASFMYSNKRMDLQETPTDKKGNPALLKCQSLDTQIYANEDDHQLKLLKEKLHRKISNASESLSVDFEMCILENEGGVVNHGKNSVRQGHSLKDLTTSLHITKINFDEIKPAEDIAKLRKTKPDLIPTLPKSDGTSSYITDRLCSEFHVKTKMQKRTGSKQNLLTNSEHLRSSVRIIESIKSRHFSVFESKKNLNTQSVVVQVHEESLPKSKKGTSVIVDDIPYSHVMDEVRERTNGKQDENIYAEICEDSCNCDSMPKCDCKRTKKANSDYCYVKLGSNGDSVIQSDSDEAIYNTLR